MNSKPSMLIAVLHVATLAGFAFAQPLYDLLGRNAEFFVSHGCGRGDLLLLIGALSLLLPGVLVLAWVVLCPGSMRPTGHGLLIGALAAVIALQAVNRFLGVAVWLVIAAAVGAGAMFGM